MLSTELVRSHFSVPSSFQSFSRCQSRFPRERERERPKRSFTPSKPHTSSPITTSFPTHDSCTVIPLRHSLRLLVLLRLSNGLCTFATHHTDELYGQVSPLHLLLGLQAHPESDSRSDPVHVRRPPQGPHRWSHRPQLRLRKKELLLWVLYEEVLHQHHLHCEGQRWVHQRPGGGGLRRPCGGPWVPTASQGRRGGHGEVVLWVFDWAVELFDELCDERWGQRWISGE